MLLNFGSPVLYWSWHHVAEQTQAHLPVGRRLMRALLDFMFGKLLGDAERAFTILRNWLIMCTWITPSGPSKSECWGIRPPGDLLKERRCFLSSTTLGNYSDNVISPKSFVPQSDTQEHPCHLHPWWLGLWGFSSDLLSYLEIMTGFPHFYEAKNLEVTDNWWESTSFWVWRIWSHREGHVNVSSRFMGDGTV